MIDLKISFQESSDGKTLTVEDQTVYLAAGPFRTAVNLFLFGTRSLGTDVIDEQFSPDKNTKLVKKWTLEPSPDGSYKLVFLAVFDFDPALDYTKNSLVAFENKLYLASEDITAGTLITAENCWYQVTRLSQILEMSSFPLSAYLISHYLKDKQTATLLGQKAIVYARKSCGCEDTCAQIEDYHWTKIYHEAALYSFGWGKYRESGSFLGMALKRIGESSKDKPCNCH
jgi:hypothetical protein